MLQNKGPPRALLPFKIIKRPDFQQGHLRGETVGEEVWLPPHSSFLVVETHGHLGSVILNCPAPEVGEDTQGEGRKCRSLTFLTRAVLFHHIIPFCPYTTLSQPPTPTFTPILNFHPQPP